MKKKIKFEQISDNQLKVDNEAYIETEAAYLKVKIIKIMSDTNAAPPFHFVDARVVTSGKIWEGKSTELFVKT